MKYLGLAVLVVCFAFVVLVGCFLGGKALLLGGFWLGLGWWLVVGGVVVVGEE